MSNGRDVAVMGGFPRPGRALWGVILTVFGVWLAFAVAMAWGNVRTEAFLFFCGNTQKILHGEVWRLLTAPLMHPPMVAAMLFTLLGFYFLTPTLEQHWGGTRLIKFLIMSALFAYVFQMIFDLVLPRSIADKLIGDYWFGSTPVLEAVAIAWALTFRGQTVRLFFVLPVSSRGLILFVVGVSVLYVVTLERPQSGLIAPFGGMLAGWWFGGNPSPARKLWLKLKLRRLEREVEKEQKQRSRRVKRSGFRVIEGGGGRGKDGDDDDDRRGPDGKLLN